MNKTKRYVSLIIEILLIISIIFAVLSVFIKGILFNKNIYLTIFNENGTYQYIKETIYEKMDKVIGAKNVDISMKESIITDEDIKKEADNAIEGVIQYLKTGDRDEVKPVDTTIYKERVKEILNTILDTSSNKSSNELSFNDTLETTNITSSENELNLRNMALRKDNIQYNNMVYTKSNSKNGQDSILIEKLMTPNEAKSKVQSLLKEKGLTIEQARQKMIEKGITEAEAIKILEGYGISVDENSIPPGSGTIENEKDQTSGGLNDNENKKNEASNNIENNSAVNSSESANGSNIGKSFLGELQQEILNEIANNDGSNLQEKISKIEDRAIGKLDIIIDNEMQKFSVDKLMQSNTFEVLAKITSLFTKMFWVFMVLPFMLITLLVKLNNRGLQSYLVYTGRSFIISGLVMLIIFLGAYISKFYENINISIVYFQDIFVVTAKYFLSILSALGAVTLLIGLVMLIPVIKNILVNKFRN
ncbi:hypothetical protein D2A34_14875 [Clostridium chromiireducens]|uniref:Uncharacterized protein n=1 Tax=Clostridium chromiireducens TaxID=225345 RepID=A0A399ISB2_9CLOT|nr:hypothetical protein [Clostridium chromiireducens]RII34422.1 hypothetical protein D2A34_14875 [Clostridium chromiireducens]